jgi:hypothetical protein
MQRKWLNPAILYIQWWKITAFLRNQLFSRCRKYGRGKAKNWTEEGKTPVVFATMTGNNPQLNSWKFSKNQK